MLLNATWAAVRERVRARVTSVVSIPGAPLALCLDMEKKAPGMPTTWEVPCKPQIRAPRLDQEPHEQRAWVSHHTRAVEV